MNKRIPSLDEFINESKSYVDIKESKNVTYTNDPKAYLAFNEANGPYWAGFSIYSNDGDATKTKIFIHLGDRGLMMLVDGPQFRKDISDALKIDEKNYGNGIVFDIPRDEFIKMAKKDGFKKKGSNDYEKEVKDPKDGVKIVIDFLKQHISKIK